MRTLVIGDIHSGLKALQQLFVTAEISTEDTLIFLGDYVDGWSEAVETVSFLIELRKTHRCIFLKGNHDELCYEWLTKRENNPTWLAHGGTATKSSYEKIDASTLDTHLSFYRSLQHYYLDAQNRLFLHAGFTNLKGVDFEYFTKTFYWDRTLWELALSLDPNMKEDHVFYPKRLRCYKEIFIGHTPLTKIGKTTPFNAANVWNIDTGAAFKGPLTVMDVDTKEFWQSEPVHTHYAIEKGRN